MNARIVIAGAIAAFTLTAQASFTATNADTSRVLAEQREIKSEVERPMGRYSRFSDQAQARLNAAQDRIFNLLGEGKVLEQLSKDQQAELLTAVEEVKAVLTDNEKDKLECWRERKTGTNMKVTMCETVAQRERIREGAKAWKSDAMTCIPTAGGSGCGRIGE